MIRTEAPMSPPARLLLAEARKLAGGCFAFAGGISPFLRNVTTCSHCRKSSSNFAAVSNRARSSSPLFLSALWHGTQ